MKKSRIARIDEDFKKELKDLSVIRVRNGLEREVLSLREMTRCIRNAPSYPKLKEELENLPRRRNKR